MSRRGSHGLLSLIYFHNPFYLISTCLFVYGLKLFFRSGNTAVFFAEGSVGYMEPWGLLTSLAGVTTLMAVTATAVVRCGRVWEDARSLVLIVLLMLLAMAVSSDELINVLSDQDNSTQHVSLIFGLGAGFSVFITEFLLRGLQVRLPASCRLPLHAFLLLFFLWPLSLVTEVTQFSNATTRWLIAAFPMAAAGLTLCLIPAVRAGRGAVAHNGTPWTWPLFPWTPFVFLGLAVCFRSYALTMSYDPKANGHYWDTIFGLYQLVPFLLAVLVLGLEMGLTEQRPLLRKLSLLGAPLLLVLAYPWLAPWSQLPTYSAFVRLLSERLASPVLLTLIGLLAFYGWAWLRGVKAAEAGVAGCGILMSVFPADAFAQRSWQPALDQLQTTPLLIVGAIYLVVALRTRHAARFALSLLLLITAGYTASDGRLGEWSRFVLTGLAAGSVLLIAIGFRGRFAAFCREVSPAVFVIALIANTWEGWQIAGWPVAATWFGGMGLMAVLLGLVLQDAAFQMIAALQLGAVTLGGTAIGGYQFCTARLPAGVKPIVLAVVSFLSALLISTLKAGLDRRLRLYWLRRQRSSQLPGPPSPQD